MNPGYVIGLIISGILMMSIAALTIRMGESSGRVLLYYTARVEHQTAVDWLKQDIRLAGYRVESHQPGILQADNTSIMLMIFRDDETQPSLITWKTEEAIGDKIHLVRIENDQQIVVHRNIKDVDFIFMNAEGQTVSGDQLSEIRRINIKLESVPRENWGSKQLVTRYEATLSPANLVLKGN